MSEKMIINSEDDVTETLLMFELAIVVLKQLGTESRNYMAEMSKEVEWIRHQITRDRFVKADYTWFARMGMRARTLLPVLDQLEFAKLLLSKHQKYGPKPLTAWGWLGIVIRIHSKLERYINLKDNGEDASESSVDTMTDILGYCVLGYRMTKEA